MVVREFAFGFIMVFPGIRVDGLLGLLRCLDSVLEMGVGAYKLGCLVSHFVLFRT